MGDAAGGAPRSRVVASEDGAFTFVLTGSDAGAVNVERRHTSVVEGMLQTIAVVARYEGSQFRAYCEVDPLRFHYPLVIKKALRIFDELCDFDPTSP